MPDDGIPQSLPLCALDAGRPAHAAQFAATTDLVRWLGQECSERIATLDARGLLASAIAGALGGRFAVVSSFGAESAVILALAAEIDRSVPVIFLDTGKHFAETLAYRDALAARLGLTDLRVFEPQPQELTQFDPAGELWRTHPDQCCFLRKVIPLDRALDGFAGWITGRKRYHGGARAGLPRIETVNGKIKVNPLADWSAAEIQATFTAYGLPRHPLAARGFLSIGCAPCTQPVTAGGALRSGRWSGRAKSECGVHLSRDPGCGGSDHEPAPAKTATSR